ncbi:hypothetical protein EDD11_001977 [Mortierella claussenii]|nr:hypothetical protein EDD11_001977 [Mortierella claussenii]
MAMVVPSATAAVSSSLKTKETSESRFRDAICLNTVHCDTLLSALFLDEDLKDVVFEFDPPVGDEEPLSENDESMDKEKATMGLTSDNGQASGTTANGGKRAVGIPAIKAHSLILSQYNSFKTLLSSTSEEQERTGIRAIHIKDADNRSFKAMVEYIYLGRLTSENEPECLVREDKLASGLTWEGLFLVANQYGIKGLQLVAEDHLHGVKGKSALSFLFRTAYRFESLRSSMIQSVASNGDMLSKRHELKCYFDHPECGPIFADIMADGFSLYLPSNQPPRAFSTLASEPATSSTTTLRATLQPIPAAALASTPNTGAGNTPAAAPASTPSTGTQKTTTNACHPNGQHCDTLLGKLLQDSDSYDVFFQFKIANEKDEEDEEGEEELKKKEENGKRIDEMKEVDENNDATNSDSSMPSSSATPAIPSQEDKVRKKVISEANANTPSASALVAAKASTPSTTAATTDILVNIGAHKLVLSQYEYFRTMFSSAFAEGKPGIQFIQVKDTDYVCFQTLIDYLYMGRFNSGTVPKTLTEDEAVDGTPTWEDLYLIADRYNIQKLKSLAATHLLEGLNTSWALPFLFRTAYLFDELRTPVIRLVVRKRPQDLLTKQVLAQYYNHVECGPLFAEMLEEMSQLD